MVILIALGVLIGTVLNLNREVKDIKKSPEKTEIVVAEKHQENGPEKNDTK